MHAALLVQLLFAQLSPEGLVRISGNKALPEDVYLAVLKLPEGAAATGETAELVRSQLEAFLFKSGYDLAKITASVEGAQVNVALNEGRLEKIVFRGRLSLQSIRFKALLALPNDVFNRPLLERQMRELQARLAIDHVWYELVPTESIRHMGPQVTNLGTFKGVELVSPQQPWELHIFFGDKEWFTGPGVDLRAGYFDGLELGGNYQGANGIFPEDRFRAALSAGAALRNRVSDGEIYPYFSRTAYELIYFGPHGLVRPVVSTFGELVARQRFDLNLENYFNAQIDGAVHLQRQLSANQTVSLGGGARFQRMFGFREAEGLTKPLSVAELGDSFERLRPFAHLNVDLVFELPDNRWDRRHALLVDARHFFAVRDPVFGEARAFYQRVWDWGWHDIWLKARGAVLWGEVPFHYEELVAGTHLRSVFGDTYVRKVGSVGGEFRFSVTRDVYKVSLFQDVASWGELDRVTGAETVRVGTSFGPGFHALIEGMLQVDIYLAFGIDSAGRFDTGVAALLNKVF